MIPRVAIAGPFETRALQPYLEKNAIQENTPSGMGGSCLVNLALARLERGWPTDVITLDPHATQPIQRYDGDLVRLWIIRRRARKALRDGYKTEVAGIIHALSESKPDVCHANWTYEYGLASLRQNTAPSLVTVHDHAGHMLKHLGWRYTPHYFMSRKVMRRANHCTAVSPPIAAYVSGIRKQNTPVIPNTLSGLVHNTHRPSISEPLIISLLTWAKFRNATSALRAFSSFHRRHPDVRYSLLGPGFEKNGPADKWAQQHDCTDGVDFIGRVPYASALESIARASILLHPSLEDSFGAPVAEAMALGVPVIAAKEAGGPAWLCESGHGRLVSGRSITDLDQALEDVWQNKISSSVEFQQDLDRARQHINLLCGPDRVLAQWNQEYRAVMDQAS